LRDGDGADFGAQGSTSPASNDTGDYCACPGAIAVGFAGKRVGVIGTGSSSIQIVQE
jgi:hypothetical protein